jgi:hypothetical protein
MMKIVDSSIDGSPDYNKEIDRQIYKRLQTVELFPLGSLPSDSVNPIKNFTDTFNGIQAGTTADNNANTFLGSLGMTQTYPHKDNLFKGIPWELL